MFGASPKAKFDEKKKEISSAIKEGKFCTTAEPPQSSSGEFWSHLLRIKTSNDIYEPFVQCTLCQQILSYESKNGTKSLSNHVQSCLRKSNVSKSILSIENYRQKAGIPADDKRSVTVACSKFCAFDMRSFNSVNGDGFRQLCQTLFDLGYRYGSTRLAKPVLDVLLPDRTTISRTIKTIATEYRTKMNEILRRDLEETKLFEISTDYWKNSYTGDNFLTINIHYTKDENLITYILKTVLFTGSKNGENTLRTIKFFLKSYGIDSEKSHIVYLTDNASNFISGLKEEVHLRCLCHCINLVVQHSIEDCVEISMLVTSASELVTHFKKCELNQLLSVTLKQKCDTRWNSIYEMLNSIKTNFKQVEDILLERNECGDYLDKIDRDLLTSINDSLLPFKSASEQLSMDQASTLHLVIPWVNKLKGCCEVQPNDSNEIKKFKYVLLTRINEKVWLTTFHDIATFLHPLTKNLLAYSPKERKKVHQATRDMMKTLEISDDNQSRDIYPIATTYSNKKISKRLKQMPNPQSNVLLDFAQEDQSESDSDDEDDEIERYIKTKLVFRTDEHLLLWWKKWSISYSKLSILATSLHGIPASSCSIERIFSAAGRVLEERRQNLNDDVVDDILFIRSFKNSVL